MAGIPAVQAEAPIDPAAGIPAGVGNGGIVRDDSDLVLRAEAKILIHRHIEIRIPIRPLSREAAVDQYLRVFIDGPKFQNMRPAALCLRERKAFAVLIRTAGKIPTGAGRRCLSVPLLKKHRVMGPGDSLRFKILAHLFVCPVIIKADFLHRIPLLLDMTERFAVRAVNNVRLSGDSVKEALQRVPASLPLSVVHLIAVTPEA